MQALSLSVLPSGGMTRKPADSASLRAVPSRSASSWPLVAALGVTLVALVVLTSYSWKYYNLPPEARLDSPLHRQLRSSGSVGHLLILLNLLYLVRRRLVNVSWLGSMRAWMDWHVFTGLLGPAFIVLHSAFTLRTWPAIASSAALAIVVVTGLFGRYLYRLVPRVSDGREEPREELAADVDHALMALRGLGVGSVQAAELVEQRVEATVAKAGMARTGIGAIISALRSLWQLRGIAPMARATAFGAGASAESAQEIGRAAAQISRLIARVDLVDTLARGAAFWRGLHRNLVVVMLLTASLHLTIAIYLGFGP